MNFEKVITQTLTSNNFLVYVFTEEENRLESILKTKVNQLFHQKIFVWDFIDGYNENPNDLFNCKQNPLEALNDIAKYKNNNIKAFLLKDFHNFLNDISINRKLKNLVKNLENNKQYLILCGTTNNIPIELYEYVKYLHMPLPNKKEILKEIENFTYSTEINTLEYKEILVNSYLGFSIEKIRKSISQLVIQNVSTKKIIKNILKQKQEIIKSTQGLEFYLNDNLSLEIGGLSNLKQWLNIRKLTFTRKAYSYGVKMPKGILLVGIQGTGKSLSAQIISRQWNLPLFRLDISKIFASVLGESENRIQNIINTCMQSSPCILWIDEIDKIFNEYTNTNDSGTKQRVTNIFLTWLSEKDKEVFIFATANTIHKLPIELLRKGRFDEIFFVDLPNFKERLQIFYIHLKKVRPTTWNQYNIYYLSHLSKGFSGAEIEQSIIDSMYIAFHEAREFTTQDITKTIKRMIPLSVIEKDKILTLRKWGYSGKVNIA
uniref:Uncharacterized AAA domain-containing protein ycf46 n=1 Tax=Herposiphonia versicolor TaxID=2007163 RepID=A0A1Z1MFB3_9FLOR|nr:hypothetical protein [Herposiphonia versicolor]ARW64673.1 hypothetical protein [Herposiphonia versicolor]